MGVGGTGETGGPGRGLYNPYGGGWQPPVTAAPQISPVSQGQGQPQPSGNPFADESTPMPPPHGLPPINTGEQSGGWPAAYGPFQGHGQALGNPFTGQPQGSPVLQGGGNLPAAYRPFQGPGNLFAQQPTFQGSPSMSSQELIFGGQQSSGQGMMPPSVPGMPQMRPEQMMQPSSPYSMPGSPHLSYGQAQQFRTTPAPTYIRGMDGNLYAVQPQLGTPPGSPQGQLSKAEKLAAELEAIKLEQQLEEAKNALLKTKSENKALEQRQSIEDNAAASSPDTLPAKTSPKQSKSKPKRRVNRAALLHDLKMQAKPREEAFQDVEWPSDMDADSSTSESEQELPQTATGSSKPPQKQGTMDYRTLFEVEISKTLARNEITKEEAAEVLEAHGCGHTVDELLAYIDTSNPVAQRLKGTYAWDLAGTLMETVCDFEKDRQPLAVTLDNHRKYYSKDNLSKLIKDVSAIWQEQFSGSNFLEGDTIKIDEKTVKKLIESNAISEVESGKIIRMLYSLAIKYHSHVIDQLPAKHPFNAEPKLNENFKRLTTDYPSYANNILRDITQDSYHKIIARKDIFTIEESMQKVANTLKIIHLAKPQTTTELAKEMFNHIRKAFYKRNYKDVEQILGEATTQFNKDIDSLSGPDAFAKGAQQIINSIHDINNKRYKEKYSFKR